MERLQFVYPAFICLFSKYFMEPTVCRAGSTGSCPQGADPLVKSNCDVNW